MERLLAIDTSADTCSVSLYNKGEWAHFHEVLPRQHAKKVLGIIDTLLKEQAVPMSNLDCVVYGQGPGSFTGLRIAAGVASGLSMALNIPVCGVSTLTALAMALSDCPAGTKILPCIDARMSQVYWCPHLIDAQGVPQPQAIEQVSDPETLVLDGEWIAFEAIGNGWQYQDAMPDTVVNAVVHRHADRQPHAADMIRWVLATEPTLLPPGQVEPVYIRNNVTWEKQPKIGS